VALRGTYSRINERQRHILKRVGARQKKGLLKDEANASAADRRPVFLGKVRDLLAFERVLPTLGTLQETQEM
jgi:hypothetical protein